MGGDPIKTLLLFSALIANLMVSGDSFQGLSFSETTINTDLREEKAYIITIDPKSPQFEIKPALAFDQVFGFESLDEIAKKNNALAAINGGFFHSYGQPVGMVAIDHEWYTMPTGIDPVFFIDRFEKPRLEPIKARAYVELDGERFYMDGFNRFGNNKEIILYSSRYGTATRQRQPGKNIIIKDNKILAITENEFEKIPSEGYVIFIGQDSLEESDLVKYANNDAYVKVGYTIDSPKDLEPEDLATAVEVGPYLIKDGEIVVKRWENRIGRSDIPMARSALAITEDEKVMFITVESSQPGRGLGLRSLARYLLDIGVTQAAALDGGASAAMYIGGEIVNNYQGGSPRPLAGGILITLREM